MMQKIAFSAPSKVHLIGEHVVVYNKPALLAATDRTCTVTLVGREDSDIIISSNLLKNTRSIRFSQVVKKTKQARAVWEKFAEKGDISLLESIIRDVFDYIVIAIGETALYYKSDIPGVSVHVNSNIPIGSGMGSSASLAVSLVGSFTKFLKKPSDLQSIFTIANEIEKRRHGFPSGGDTAAVLYGGILRFQKQNDSYDMRPLSLLIPKRISESFLLVNTGRPTESTGEMIQIVSKFAKTNRKRSEEIFDSQEELTEKLIDALGESNLDTIQYCFTHAQRNLEEMGVVSDRTTELVKEIENIGAVAKISGAGGRAEGSGMLLVHTAEKECMKQFLKKKNIEFFDANLGVTGLTEL